MAIKEQSLSTDDLSTNTNIEKDFEAHVYHADDNDGVKLYLGKMVLENEGSLLIIGGKGKSGSIKESKYIFTLFIKDVLYLNRSPILVCTL
jgi:hypothetical protein